MDVRKKLVEIVKKAAYSSLPSNTEDFHLNMFVTNLLSHGVTVQEWISVDDRLPEPEQSVILYTREIETYGKYYEKKENLSQYLYGLLRWGRMAYELLPWLRVHFQDERKISERND